MAAPACLRQRAPAKTAAAAAVSLGGGLPAKTAAAAAVSMEGGGSAGRSVYSSDGKKRNATGRNATERIGETALQLSSATYRNIRRKTIKLSVGEKTIKLNISRPVLSAVALS